MSKTEPGNGLMPATLETWIMFPWLVVRWGELALVRMKADLGNNYEGSVGQKPALSYLVLRFITLS